MTHNQKKKNFSAALFVWLQLQVLWNFVLTKADILIPQLLR